MSKLPTLAEVYEKITALEVSYEDMRDKELLELSNEVYNTLVVGLIPKRRVLLNELLDLETEIRSRNNR